MRLLRVIAVGAVAILGYGFFHFAQSQDPVAKKARELHFASIVLDTHIDTTLRIARPDWKFTEEHAPMPPGVSSQPESKSQKGHADLPRIRKGGLDGLFFGVVVRGTITGPQAVHDALGQVAAVHKLAQDLPNDVALCTTADEVRKANREGKVAALISLEGGHMINNSLPLLRMFAKLGVRYITMTHFYHTDWADSSGPDEPRHNGLTDLGKQIVLEMNRLGVMVDISHVSDKTFWDILAASQAPLIASHSSCRALSGHVRNMSDEMIRALAAKGGVIHINYHSPYLDEDRYQYWKKTQALVQELTKRYPGEENDIRRQHEVEKEFGPAPKVSWEKIIDHIDHVVRLTGPGHVGLGSDFDGAIMPDGMEDVTHLPKITEVLLRKGYSESDVRKILGENTLRVMSEVERVSREMHSRGSN